MKSFKRWKKLKKNWKKTEIFHDYTSASAISEYLALALTFSLVTYLKWTLDLSPVLKQSASIPKIDAVCRIGPQCTIAWYRTEMVVGWCRTMMSASNSQQASGFSLGETITIPFLICDLLIFFKAKEAVWPLLTSPTGILLRCILLMAIGMKWPSGSGPNNKVSFNLMVPFKLVPKRQFHSMSHRYCQH